VGEGEGIGRGWGQADSRMTEESIQLPAAPASIAGAATAPAPYLIREMPLGERPRERLASLGAEHLAAEDLLAILLRTGLRGRSVMTVARELLARFRTLNRMCDATLDELRMVKGVGRDKAVTLKAAFELARRMARELREEQPLLDTPARIAQFLREENRNEGTERLDLILLNTRRRLLRHERLAHGTQDTLLVNPREVFRTAILAGAAAVVLAHNHPSGDPSPSEADIRVTRDLIRAGQLLRIEVLDHIIMGHKTPERSQDYVSLRELGYCAM
jgi:DNA repair protein RadC